MTEFVSFGHGLASAHIGFLAAHEDVAARLEKQSTPYRIPALTEALAIAALEDTSHLDYIRSRTDSARRFLTEAIERHPGLTTVPSETNFILVRAAGHLSARSIAVRLEQYGILVRVFEGSTGDGLDTMFRVTTGTVEENEFFVDALDAVISAETTRSKLVAD